MRSFILDVLTEVIEEVFFGTGCPKVHRVEGMNVPMAIEKTFDLITIAMFKHPLNALSGGLLGKYKLIEPVKQAFKLGDKIKDLLTLELETREALAVADLGDGLLDVCLKHNKKCTQEEKISHLEVVQACMIIKLAAIDTSRNTTEFMLNHFVNDQPSLEWFQDYVVEKLRGQDKL